MIAEGSKASEFPWNLRMKFDFFLRISSLEYGLYAVFSSSFGLLGLVFIGSSEETKKQRQ